MSTQSIEQQILGELEKLDRARQERVLEYTRALVATPLGKPGSALLASAGTIDQADLASMSRSIEEGCESVDVNGW